MSQGVTGSTIPPAPETRRDFLYVATGMAAAVGTAATLWPFIDSMRPSADVGACRLALNRVPFGLASAREHGLLRAELGFEAFGDAYRVVSDRRRVHGLADRQYVRQQSGSDTVGRM